MPELPEVEVVRAGLARHVVGSLIEDVEVRRPYSVRTHGAGVDDLVDRLRGRVLGAAVRRGKFLWLPLGDADGPRTALMAHLGMSGQLLVRRPGVRVDLEAPVDRDGPRLADAVSVPVADAVSVPVADALEVPAGGPSADPDRHLRVGLRLRPPTGSPSRLDFVDQRTFGHLSVQELVATSDGGPGGHGSPDALLPRPVAGIARDLLDPALDRDLLVEAIRRRRTGVKRALLDQGLVSGVGNIYADEGLWRARLHYARPTDTLRRAEAHRLLDACAEVMWAALAAGGTSFDSLYVNVNGSSGYFSRSLAAYGQAGRPCPRCGTPIRRDEFMNRSSYTCPSCQPRPRNGRW